jgi:hypothetical protein
MKKINISSLIIILIAGSITLFSFVFISPVKTHPTAKAKGFAVVELFTSEGCSSCPAADAAVAKLLRKNIANTYILSYHVDYWNRLGWKDEFSHQAYSARQQQYARYLSLEGVYTPQVVVNGTVEFVGSNESRLNNAVSNGLNNGTISNLSITAVRQSNSLVINYNLTGTEALVLNTAIVLPEATTQVKRGENGGRTLQHVNIVKDLKVIDAKGSGELTMDLPKELKNKPFKVISYTQSKQTFKVIGADEVDL